MNEMKRHCLKLGRCVCALLLLSPVGSYAQAPAPPLIPVSAENRPFESDRKLAWLITYEDLKQTDFFRFFHLQEMGTSATTKGMTRMTLKTGGFQDAIDLALTLDAERRVIAAEMRLTRAWIGNTRHVSPFATDIAASFLRTFASDVNRAQLQSFSDGLRKLHGTEDRIIAPGRQRADVPPPEVLELLRTFTGSAQRFEAKLQGLQATAFNADSPTRAQWVLTMVATAPPGAARTPAADASRPAKPGGTLLAQAEAMFALTGRRPKVLLSERYAALEPKLAGDTLPAAELVRVIQLAVNVSNVDRTAVSIMVYDGRAAHTINVTGTSTDLSTTTYFDPLGSGSFLQQPNNVAGIEATPAPGRPRYWNVATPQLEQVLYGAILNQQDVESMNQVALMLRDPSAAIPKALEQKSRSPHAPRVQAATWQRLSVMFQRQGSTTWAAGARRLAAALQN